VGEAARNQQALYPERTVRSIKRKMGSEEKVRVGKKDFLPQESPRSFCGNWRSGRTAPWASARRRP